MTKNNRLPEMCIAPYEIQEGDLVAYLDGDVSSYLARHIALCPACSAEVKSLRRMDILLAQALQPGAQQVHPAGYTNGRSHQNGLRESQPLLDRRRLFGVSLPVVAGGLVAASVLLLVGFIVGFNLMLERTPPPVNEQNLEVASLAPKAVIPFTVSGEVVVEAATPDVDQQQINRHGTGSAMTSQTIVDSLTGISGSVPLSGYDRHTIIHPGVIDVSIAGRLVREKRFEIAPPLALRPMFEKELKEETTELLVSTEYTTENYLEGTDGNDYLVWAENRNGLTRLYFAFSTDAGQNWGPSTLIDARVGRAFNPKLALDLEGNLYVVWRNWYNIDSNAFYFSRSADKGQAWDRTVRIEYTTGTTVRPNLAVDSNSGHLYVTWENRRYADATGIYITHSSDGGQTWSNKVRMVNIGS